jgi:hypothetical protein
VLSIIKKYELEINIHIFYTQFNNRIPTTGGLNF